MAKNKLIEQPKEVEKVETKEVEAPQYMNPNSGKGIKIKLVDGKNFKWITVKPGDIVTISKKIAKANGLVRVK